MIQYSEVAMVNAASYALSYKDKNPYADVEEIIKNVVINMDSISIKKNFKIFGIAAANEILKLKKQHKDKTNKQILQIFVNNVSEFLNRLEEG